MVTAKGMTLCGPNMAMLQEQGRKMKMTVMVRRGTTMEKGIYRTWQSSSDSWKRKPLERCTRRLCIHLSVRRAGCTLLSDLTGRRLRQHSTRLLHLHRLALHTHRPAGSSGRVQATTASRPPSRPSADQSGLHLCLSGGLYYLPIQAPRAVMMRARPDRKSQHQTCRRRIIRRRHRRNYRRTSAAS